MESIKIKLENCYGIKSFDETLSFKVSSGIQNRAIAIYAPNGLMKTSFTRVFEDLAKGKTPKEERYNRDSSCTVEVDGNIIPKEIIYVLRSDIDIVQETTAFTNVLVDPAKKARYDELVVDIEKAKTKLIAFLQKKSKVKKDLIESTIISDTGKPHFFQAIQYLYAKQSEIANATLEYQVVFDSKAQEVINSTDFLSSAKDFNQRYQEIFTQAGTIYKKGLFNPAKADTSFQTLDKNSFFKTGHKVHLEGDSQSIGKEDLDKRLSQVNKAINEDENLKAIQDKLVKNAQTQALIDLFESLDATGIEEFIEWAKPEKSAEFKKELWHLYLFGANEANNYLEAFRINQQEIHEIETVSATAVPQWQNAVTLFNNRFVDMPFTLVVDNLTAATLGKEPAKLSFVCQDGQDTVKLGRNEIKATLSQGEKRAMYLLNFIFDVEERKTNNQETLFIIDDVADSFDYKNKHAIVQYLIDLCSADFFHQIIPTHNFDFFRTVSDRYIHRKRLYMANRVVNGIKLEQAEGINNIFINKWKANLHTSQVMLCASIPFLRNLIEYQKGSRDIGYLRLTSLLHWKEDTDSITVADFWGIYNSFFNSDHNSWSAEKLVDLIFNNADAIASSTTHQSLCLEDKVLMSIAIRLSAEKHMIMQIRTLSNDSEYWPEGNSQFGVLRSKYSLLAQNSIQNVQTIEKVALTISSNIHLNSFMYEPILDLTIDHLISLYNEVKALPDVIINPELAEVQA